MKMTKLAALLSIILVGFLGCATMGKRAKCIGTSLTDEVICGNWYQGDHLGFNLFLELKSDCTYEASVSGCMLQTYGEAKGKWATAYNSLVLMPDTETGCLRGDYRCLRIFKCADNIIFVPEDSLEYFYKWGSESSPWCFYKEPE
jgi:hypothetical protein